MSQYIRYGKTLSVMLAGKQSQRMHTIHLRSLFNTHAFRTLLFKTNLSQVRRELQQRGSKPQRSGVWCRTNESLCGTVECFLSIRHHSFEERLALQLTRIFACRLPTPAHHSLRQCAGRASASLPFTCSPFARPS